MCLDPHRDPADADQAVRLRQWLAPDLRTARDREELCRTLRAKGFELRDGANGPVLASWPTGDTVCDLQTLWPGALVG